MRRRQFITLLGGAAAWPLASRAQQADRVRRIGVLLPADETFPEAKARISVFTQALAGSGWAEGRNVRIDLRWGRGDANRMRALAQELVGLQPDIIVATTTAPTVALQRATRTIPIVFVNVADPVASGIVPTEKPKRPSRPLGASREPVLSSYRMYSRSRIARRSYWRRPETTYRRSIRCLPLLETAACSPTDPARA